MSDNPLTTENAASIVARAKAIIMTPKEEWPRIAAEGKTPTQVLLTYALPLIAIGPICTLIGMQVFGFNAVLFTIRPSIGFSISTALSSFIMGVISLYLVSFLANLLSPKFGGKDDFSAAFRLVAYSYTVSWVIGVLGLIVPLVPILGILGLLALYGIYLLYLGATPVMGVPEEKATGYVAVLIVAAIVLSIIGAALTSRIVGMPGAALYS